MKLFTTGAMFIAVMLAMPGASTAQQDALVTKSGPIVSPMPGKGLVVFFRPGSLMGAALGCTVHEGETEVARLGSGKFYAVPVEPGKHLYFTQAETTDRLNLEVEDGETYFVRCKLGMGIAAGRPNLSPSTREEFAGKAKGLSMWKGPKAGKEG